MKHTMTVQHMTCGHCEKAVYNALSKEKGVESVDVNLETSKVSVVYNEAAVTLDRLKEAVENQGYDVVN